MNRDRQKEFAQQFVRFQRSVYGYIVTLLPDWDDAEEVFQRTAVILWEKWDQFDPSRSFVSWACGVARNEVRNFLRQKQRGGVYLSDELMDQVAQERLKSERMLERRRRLLAECLERLQARHRRLIERCYLGEDPIKRIAQKLRLTPSALYMRLHRIRTILLECIDRALAGESP